jgi:hypothetical protein
MFTAFYYASCLISGVAITCVAWQSTDNPLLKTLLVMLAWTFAGVLWFVH